MRVLCLLGWCPLPVRTADDERLVSILDVWSSVADLDVVVRGRTTGAEQACLEEHLGSALVAGLPEADTPARRGRLGWLLRRRLPFDVAELDPRPARRHMRELIQLRARPDAVFASDPFMAWLLRGVVPPVPWLLDLPRVHGPSPWSVPVRSIGDARQLLKDRSIVELLAIDRAARFELLQAGIAHAATVRSADDRESLGSPTASVIADAAVAHDYRDLALRTIAEAGTYASKGWS